jgi:hypothetical protein
MGHAPQGLKVGVMRVCKKLGKYLTYNPVANLVFITDANYRFSTPGTCSS